MTNELMYRILNVLRDPKMGYRKFIIHQTECTRHNGRVIETKTAYGTGGVIHPGTEKNRELLPEEYRQDEYIAVFSRIELSTGKEVDPTYFREADIIDPYDDTYWRVVMVKKWGDPPNSFYVAMAVKTDEEP